MTNFSGEQLFALTCTFPLLGVLLALGIRNHKIGGLVALVASWGSFFTAIFCLLPIWFSGQNLILFSGYISCDKLSAAFILLTGFVMASSLSQAYLFFQAENVTPEINKHIKLFYAFSLLFLLSMYAVFLCDNLGALWISVEATSLLSAGLVYFSRTKNAIEATWKYLIICSVGIAFALMGTILIFASSQYGAIENGSLSAVALQLNSAKLHPLLLRLGFIFCLVGYGTKAGLFPLHSWLPDAHSEAPAPASAMLSAGLLNCALFAIWKIQLIAASSTNGAHCLNESLCAGVVTILAASLFLIRQHGLKRLWAYSSIENVGIMLVAIGLQSAPLFFLQALNHSLAKVSLFCVSGNIIQTYGTKDLSHLSGLLKLRPCDAVLLALGALAVTGTPPFGTFVSEWLLLACAMGKGHWILTGIILLSLTIAFISVFYHVGRILTGGTPQRDLKVLGFKHSLIPLTLIVASLILGFIVNPQLLRLVG